VNATAQDAASIRGLPRVACVIKSVIFVLAVPLFLIATNVNLVTRDLGFYESEFATYRVAESTGLTTVQLREVARAFIAYFDGSPDSLDIQVHLAGARRPLFNEREIAHMVDVHHLMTLVRRLGAAAGVAALGIVLVGFLLVRQAFVPLLGKLCLTAAALTWTLLALLGGLAMLDFSELFVRFHLLSFSNDLWVLDPQRDYLIRLFPEGFWYDATVRIALLTLLESSALALLGGGLRLGVTRR